MVVINTKSAPESTAVPPPPPPISPLVGAWGDQPWSRGNSEIVAGSAAGDLPELNPEALLQHEAGDGEHSEQSVAMTDEPHEEDSPTVTAQEAPDAPGITSVDKQGSEDYWPEESEVVPQQHYAPEAHHAQSMGSPYPSTACSCAECMQCGTQYTSGSYDYHGMPPRQAYTHSPYASSNYSAYTPQQAYQPSYGTLPCQERCSCPSCVQPQKRVFRYNLPPPPPITADTILQNTPALQHIMFKWYHKVQDIELGPVPPCPAPATESYDPGYTFHQWMSMCSEWYHSHFFTGRVRRQTSPAPSPRPTPTYNRWGTGY